MPLQLKAKPCGRLVAVYLPQAASVVGGYALSRFARLPLRPWPPLRVFAAQVGPVVVACVGTMYCGNLAYLHLSVAFIQILKACTPVSRLRGGPRATGWF
jgi:hypothetical protein